jgi:hypothetical protein
LEFLFLRGDWPITERFGLERIHFHGVVRYYNSEEIDLRLFEFALFNAEEEVFLATPFQQASDVFAMCFCVAMMGIFVVNEYFEPTLSDEVGESMVDSSLHGRRGITLSKEHYQGFEVSQLCTEGSFPFVSFSNSNVLETPANIEGREDCRPSEIIEDCFDSG